ncbi:hypothetical protein AAVH_32626, partial [Aphelenchoides avenae]
VTLLPVDDRREVRGRRGGGEYAEPGHAAAEDLRDLRGLRAEEPLLLDRHAHPQREVRRGVEGAAREAREDRASDAL